MKLHENGELFRQAIQFTAQEKGIPEIFVEKDYWVTVALFTLFSSDIGPELVFQGRDLVIEMLWRHQTIFRRY